MKDNVPILMQSELGSAPWNQSEMEPIQADCTVCYCISKTMPVEVRNYTKDDAGTYLDDTNLMDEYNNDSKAIGIPTLLEELQELSQKRIEELRTELTMTTRFTPEGTREQIISDIRHYEKIIKASKDWVVDDLDIIKEE